jgi:hypothetical protein
LWAERRRIGAVALLNSKHDLQMVRWDGVGVKTIRSRALILLILAALVGLSVTVRAQQVHCALRGTSELTMGTKANVRAQADVDIRPALQFTAHVVDLPRVTERVYPRPQVEPAASDNAPWYSVSVRRRPPPQSLA